MEENNLEIRISIGKTISLGKGSFEFVRIDIGITQKCSIKEKEACYKSLREDLMDKLATECDIIEKNKKIWPDCE